MIWYFTHLQFLKKKKKGRKKETSKKERKRKKKEGKKREGMKKELKKESKCHKARVVDSRHISLSV